MRGDNFVIGQTHAGGDVVAFNRRDADVQTQINAMAAMFGFIKARQRFASDPRKHAIHRLQHGHFLTHFAQHRCGLKPDIATADNHNVRDIIQAFDHVIHIGPGPDNMHTAQIAPRDRQLPRVAACGPDHMAIGNDCPVRSRDGMRGSINRLHALAEQHIHRTLRPKRSRPDHDAFKRLVAREIVLGQWWALIRIFRLGIDDSDAAFEFCLPQCDGRLRTAMAATDDENVIMHR